MCYVQCDNHCAYCVIPSLRGKYRSRPMNELLDEAAELASAGVKELIVIAQDITRYGTDRNGEHQLAKLLKELCKLDFHWIQMCIRDRAAHCPGPRTAGRAVRRVQAFWRCQNFGARRNSFPPRK